MSSDPRPQLTRSAIVDAAIRIADVHGLTRLSMRNLAGDLGYEAMSLYTHVRNKADLHTTMVDRCIDELELPEIDETFAWRPTLRRHALDLKALFDRHPWAVELWLQAYPGPRRFDLMEWQLAAFAASGLPDLDAHTLFHAFGNHVVGFMLQRHAMTYAGDDEAIAQMLSTLDPERHEFVLQHVEQHRNGDAGDSFELTLDLLLGR